MAGAVILAGQVWLGLGALVSAAWLTVGVGRVDEAARGAWLFRLIVLPGCVLLWPLVLRRWVSG